MRKWISVKNRLPKNDSDTTSYTKRKRYVVLTESGLIDVGMFGLWGHDWWIDNHSGRLDVTHWMPLPKLPKGDAK